MDLTRYWSQVGVRARSCRTDVTRTCRRGSSLRCLSSRIAVSGGGVRNTAGAAPIRNVTLTFGVADDAVGPGVDSGVFESSVV
jgi:hypothetical protein